MKPEHGSGETKAAAAYSAVAAYGCEGRMAAALHGRGQDPPYDGWPSTTEDYNRTE